MVDDEIKKLLTEAHSKVRECLGSHRQALEEVAKLLLEKEVVEQPALQAILKQANCADHDRDEKPASFKALLWVLMNTMKTGCLSDFDPVGNNLTSNRTADFFPAFLAGTELDG